jgi:hypothetical protein
MYSNVTEPWWLRGLIEHNQFLTLNGKECGSNPGTAVYVNILTDELSPCLSGMYAYTAGRRFWIVRSGFKSGISLGSVST